MEIQDHSLMVVSLDNNISTVGGNVGKTSSCIYTAAMSGGHCSHEASVVELGPPVQCLGTAIPRLQHQHLTQLQPIHYPQTISYESGPPMQHANIVPSHAIYQPLSSAPLHHYQSSQAVLNNSTYLNTTTTLNQTIHLAPAPIISASPAVTDHPPQEIHLPPVSEQLSVNQTSEIEEVGDPDDPEEGLPEPTFPEDDYEYYKEIFSYLCSMKYPDGVSENYQKHLAKRAQHYLVTDGKLYHNRKQPKEVIMKKEDQQAMIKNNHVIKETGVHLGVKKLFHKVQSKHFWRGMYIDVVTFVKNCDKCSDIADMVRQKQLNGDFNKDVDGSISNVAVQCSESSKIWKKVEVWIHGPLNQTCSHKKFLVTVVDHESRWITAAPVSSLDAASEIADFLFHTFCSYGFPSCDLVGFSVKVKDSVTKELKWRMENLPVIDVKFDIVEESAATCLWVKELINTLEQMYPEWDKNLNSFLFEYRIGRLKSYHSSKLFSPFSALFNHNPLNTKDMGDEDKENDENLNISKEKEFQNNLLQCKHCDEVFLSKISFRIHQRKHMVSAKISHQNSIKGDTNYKHRSRHKKKNKSSGKDVLEIHSPPLSASVKSAAVEDFKPPEACVESTVSAVKALLAKTKEDRRRRGKYHKYSPELQEHMAAYAVKYGNQQAVRYFSDRLGTVVSESTIRNIVKVHSSFTPLVKEEIGRFAANFGVDSAARYFSERLKRDIPQALVRKFKVIHLRKLPETNKRQNDKTLSRDLKRRCIIKKGGDFSSNKHKRYSNRVKEEIGLYACQHSILDTVNHFSEKLQMNVKERTVRKFHKAYLDKYHLLPVMAENQQMPTIGHHSSNAIPSVNMNLQPQHQTQAQPLSIYSATPYPQQVPATTSTTCMQPPRPVQPSMPLYPLNQCSPEKDCFSTSMPSVIMTQGSSSFHYQNINPIQNFQPPESYSIHQNIPSVSHEPQTIPRPDQSSFIMTSQPIIVPSEPNNLNISTHFMVAPPPISPRTEIQQPPVVEKNEHKPNSDENDIQVFIAVKCENENNRCSFNSDNNSLSTNLNINSTVKVSDIASSNQETGSSVNQTENEVCIDDSEEEPLIKRLNKIQEQESLEKESQKKRESKKRGKYTFYSPELRAEIGKYAAEHSSVKACKYFSKLLGHELPESTARGLKEKYLQKKLHCSVTSLGYSQRGRPLRLGKYDEIVQECLKELVRHGEKVTSHLAITTAKLILNKYEPGLLEENGGTIKLNITWAKSFLKRIGVHNNS